jgi:hypothetical protein
MAKVLIILVASMLAGCAPQSPRPDFLVRSLQDCASGDQSACAMLSSLSSTPVTVSDTNVQQQRARTQQERDADAIMEGIRRARSAPAGQNLRMAPSSNGDS